MPGYQTPEDLAFLKDLIAAARPEGEGFLALSNAAERKDGEIPSKYRELISIAVALTTQCAYCLDVHVKNAVAAGVTRRELAETVFIASSLRAGAAAAHGTMTLRLFEEASKPAG